MRRFFMRSTMASALAAGLCCANAAQAGVPVFDIVNAVQNVFIKGQLAAINKTLSPAKGDQTINYYSKQIDKSTTNIDESTTHIDESTTNIDESTANISVLTTINTSIDNDFTWIISIGEDPDEIVPIPTPVDDKLKAILDGRTSDQYAAQFRTAKYYVDSKDDEDFQVIGLEGSRARKAANDALVKSIETDQIGLKNEAGALHDLGEKTNKLKGHARQLQIANAVAGLQADQLMKLRSMMLVSEAARAAEAQAAADKDARAIATSKAMRNGIAAEREQTIAPQPKY